jgi:hypothetical protein
MHPVKKNTIKVEKMFRFRNFARLQGPHSE